MSNSKDKIQNLKDRIDNYEKKKTNKINIKKNNGANFGFKISTEIVSALVVGVGIGLIGSGFMGKAHANAFRTVSGIFNLYERWFGAFFRWVL